MSDRKGIIESHNLIVHAPIRYKKLGIYRRVAGVFLIRERGSDEVLYIGKSMNLWSTIVRLFYSQGKLENISKQELSFEILTCSHIYMSTMAHIYLRNYFKPSKNANYKPRKLSKAEQRQRKRILDLYNEQSIFYKEAPRGEHRSDS